METSLHRTLKERFGASAGGATEVWRDGYRVDAVSVDGEVIEIQSAALSPLRDKLEKLLPGSRTRVVKPVVLTRRVVRRDGSDGPDLSSRLSPKRGDLSDVFEDLVGLARSFPHPNLTVEVFGVAIDEIRVPRRRRPGYAVADRSLREVLSSMLLKVPGDLWRLLPGAPVGPFTTLDLAERLGRPRPFAQKVAYCLFHAGAVSHLGKRGNNRVYERNGGDAWG